jgi:hypothetical protein
MRVSLLDVLLFKCGRRSGLEIKRMEAQSLPGWMRIALANLQLQKSLEIRRPYQSQRILSKKSALARG